MTIDIKNLSFKMPNPENLKHRLDLRIFLKAITRVYASMYLVQISTNSEGNFLFTSQQDDTHAIKVPYPL